MQQLLFLFCKQRLSKYRLKAEKRLFKELFCEINFILWYREFLAAKIVKPLGIGFKAEAELVGAKCLILVAARFVSLILPVLSVTDKSMSY